MALLDGQLPHGGQQRSRFRVAAEVRVRGSVKEKGEQEMRLP